MAGFNITITDNLGNVIERIESAITQCSDFTPLWSALRKPWEDSRRDMYLSQGRSTGTPWLGYEDTDEADWYVWWKAAVTDQVIESPSDLNDLLLRWTQNERLYPSLTNTRSRFAIWREEPLALSMGTRAPGAANNNDGKGRAPRRMGGHDIPRRALLSFGRIFTRQIAAKQSDFAGIISRFCALFGLTFSVCLVEKFLHHLLVDFEHSKKFATMSCFENANGERRRGAIPAPTTQPTKLS